MGKLKNRRRTPEDKNFIITNFKNKSIKELVEETGLTAQQVYLTIRETKQEIDKKIESAETEDEKLELLDWKEENLPDGRKNNSKPKNNLIKAIEELGEFTIEHAKK